MTPDRTDPPATGTNTHADPEADARFAAFLAEAAANVDDPELGEVYRMILDDPPDMQRALFDVGEVTATTPGGILDGSDANLGLLLYMLVLVAGALVAAVVMFDAAQAVLP